MKLKDKLRLPKTELTFSGIYKPRVPQFDKWKTESIIRSPYERDELVEDPECMQHLTTNVIQRAYSRGLIHDGVKWIAWPLIPTGSIINESTNMPAAAGATVTIYECTRRGALTFIGFNVNSPKFQIDIIADDRFYLRVYLEFFYNNFSTGSITEWLRITKWDEVNNNYSMIFSRPVLFCGSLKVTAKNWDSSSKIINKSYIWIDLHETRAYLLAKEEKGE